MLFISIPTLSAQNNTWQVIRLSDDTVTACRLDSLHDNVLYATCGIKAFFFPVDSIAALVQHKEGRFWKYAVTGSWISAGAGAIIGFATYQKPTSGWAIDFGPSGAAGGGLIIGAASGFVVGGIIGALDSDSKTYDLKGKTLKVKLQIIHSLLNN
jgi:hypothetical protein